MPSHVPSSVDPNIVSATLAGLPDKLFLLSTESANKHGPPDGKRSPQPKNAFNTML